jgi:predicted RNA-binding Zn-ribbon protein involved in translation (DUF1610 family)
MRAGEVLQLWERADGLGPVARALALAEAAGGDASGLRDRPFGRTNAHVLALRESLLSGDLAATSTCPACGERVEFALDPATLHALLPAGEGAGLVFGEYIVDWRLPTPDDLVAVAAAPDPEGALRQRCMTVLFADGEQVDAAVLPRAAVEAVEASMAEADPLAEVLVALDCPECGARFEADLDLGSFVWAEVDARARRLLHEVDVLARAYGWTEPEVLALSEARRAAYLRLVLDGAP